MATPIHALSGMGSASMAALGNSSTPTLSAAGAAPFSDLLTGALGQVDTLQAQAEAAMNGLMTGAGVDVRGPRCPATKSLGRQVRDGPRHLSSAG